MKDYIAEKEDDFRGRLQKAFEDKEITLTYYDYARNIRCDAEDWDSVFDHFTMLNEGLIEQLESKEKYFLLERIEAGYAYVHREDITDVQRAKGWVLYNKLCEELEEMK